MKATLQVPAVVCALLFITMITAHSANAQGVGGMLQSIGKSANSVVSSFDIKKLNNQPQRDLMTLAIGGVVGFAIGGFVTNLGILNIQVLGLAVIPIVSGLAGFYMANDGYFDGARDLLRPKSAPPGL